MSFCMELSCKTCLSKLVFRLLRGTIVHELPFEAIVWVFAWSCRAKATFSKFFLKLLHGTVVQKLPFQATYQAFAWNCRANVALWSYFLSFCMELSCKRCLTNYFLSLRMELSRKSCLSKLFLKLCLELSCKSCLARLSLKVKCRSVFQDSAMCFSAMAEVLGAVWVTLGAVDSVCSWCRMEVSCTSCLSQLLLKLLHGTVVKKFPCKATSQLLHGTVVPKLRNELLHATVVQKPPCKTMS